MTGLGAYAFHRCHELKRVVLPGSAEELGACAFLYCDSLKEIRMPGVKKLGNQAFLNDMQLERLQISRELDPQPLNAPSPIVCIPSGTFRNSSLPV